MRVRRIFRCSVMVDSCRAVALLVVFLANRESRLLHKQVIFYPSLSALDDSLSLFKLEPVNDEYCGARHM